MDKIQQIKFQNQNQLLKSWTLSFRDKVMGHLLLVVLQQQCQYEARGRARPNLASGHSGSHAKLCTCF